MFGRATITLGIGPHSSSFYILRRCAYIAIIRNDVQLSTELTIYCVILEINYNFSVVNLKPRLHDTTCCQTGGKCLYTRYYRLSNPFDNRLYRVYKHSTGCQTVFVKPVVQPGLATGCVV